MLHFTVQLLYLATLGLTAELCGENIPITGQGFHVDFYSYPLGSTAGSSINYFLYDYEKVGPYIGSADDVTDINFSSTDYVPGVGDVYGFQTTRGHFAMELTGYFRPPESGNYVFTLDKNDDALSLQFGYAENAGCCEIFDNQLTQSIIVSRYTDAKPQTETFTLEKGIYYPIRLFYYNRIGTRNLNLKVTYPDNTVKDTFTDVYQLDSDYFCPKSSTSTNSEKTSLISTNGVVSATAATTLHSSWSTRSASILKSSKAGSKTLNAMTISTGKPLSSSNTVSSSISSMVESSKQVKGSKHKSKSPPSRSSSGSTISDQFTSSLEYFSSRLTTSSATTLGKSRTQVIVSSPHLPSTSSRRNIQPSQPSSQVHLASPLPDSQLRGPDPSHQTSRSVLVASSSVKSAAKRTDSPLTTSRGASSLILSRVKGTDKDNRFSQVPGSPLSSSNFAVKSASQTGSLFDSSEKSSSLVYASISKTDIMGSSSISMKTGVLNTTKVKFSSLDTSSKPQSSTAKYGDVITTKSGGLSGVSSLSSSSYMLNTFSEKSSASIASNSVLYGHSSGYKSISDAASARASNADNSNSGLSSGRTSVNPGKGFVESNAWKIVNSSTLSQAHSFAEISSKSSLSFSESSLSRGKVSTAATIDASNFKLSKTRFSGVKNSAKSKTGSLGIAGPSSTTSTLSRTLRPSSATISNTIKWSTNSQKYRMSSYDIDAHITQEARISSSGVSSNFTFGTSTDNVSHSGVFSTVVQSSKVLGTSSRPKSSPLNSASSGAVVDNKSESDAFSKDVATESSKKTSLSTLKVLISKSHASVFEKTASFRSSVLRANLSATQSSKVGSWIPDISNSGKSIATNLGKPGLGASDTIVSNVITSSSTKATLLGSAISTLSHTGSLHNGELGVMASNRSRGDESITQLSSKFGNNFSTLGVSKDSSYSSIVSSTSRTPSFHSLKTIASAAASSTNYGASTISHGSLSRNSTRVAASDADVGLTSSKVSMSAVTAGESVHSSHVYLASTGADKFVSSYRPSPGTIIATPSRKSKVGTVGTGDTPSSTLQIALSKYSGTNTSNTGFLGSKATRSTWGGTSEISALNSVSSDSVISFKSNTGALDSGPTNLTTSSASINDEARGIAGSVFSTDASSSTSSSLSIWSPLATILSKNNSSRASTLNNTVSSWLNFDASNTDISNTASSIFLINSSTRTAISGNMKTDSARYGTNTFSTKSSRDASYSLASDKNYKGYSSMVTSTPCSTCTSRFSDRGASSALTLGTVHSDVPKNEDLVFSHATSVLSAVWPSASSLGMFKSASSRYPGIGSSQPGASGAVSSKLGTVAIDSHATKSSNSRFTKSKVLTSGGIQEDSRKPDASNLNALKTAAASVQNYASASFSVSSSNSSTLRAIPTVSSIRSKLSALGISTFRNAVSSSVSSTVSLSKPDEPSSTVGFTFTTVKAPSMNESNSESSKKDDKLHNGVLGSKPAAKSNTSAWKIRSSATATSRISDTISSKSVSLGKTIAGTKSADNSSGSNGSTSIHVESTLGVFSMTKTVASKTLIHSEIFSDKNNAGSSKATIPANCASCASETALITTTRASTSDIYPSKSSESRTAEISTYSGVTKSDTMMVYSSQTGGIEAMASGIELVNKSRQYTRTVSSIRSSRSVKLTENSLSSTESPGWNSERSTQSYTRENGISFSNPTSKSKFIRSEATFYSQNKFQSSSMMITESSYSKEQVSPISVMGETFPASSPNTIGSKGGAFSTYSNTTEDKPLKSIVTSSVRKVDYVSKYGGAQFKSSIEPQPFTSSPSTVKTLISINTDSKTALTTDSTPGKSRDSIESKWSLTESASIPVTDTKFPTRSSSHSNSKSSQPNTVPNWSKPTWVASTSLTVTTVGPLPHPTTVTSIHHSGNRTISVVTVISPISSGAGATSASPINNNLTPSRAATFRDDFSMATYPSAHSIEASPNKQNTKEKSDKASLAHSGLESAKFTSAKIFSASSILTRSTEEHSSGSTRTTKSFYKADITPSLSSADISVKSILSGSSKGFTKVVPSSMNPITVSIHTKSRSPARTSLYDSRIGSKLTASSDTYRTASGTASGDRFSSPFVVATRSSLTGFSAGVTLTNGIDMKPVNTDSGVLSIRTTDSKNTYAASTSSATFSFAFTPVSSRSIGDVNPTSGVMIDSSNAPASTTLKMGSSGSKPDFASAVNGKSSSFASDIASVFHDSVIVPSTVSVQSGSSAVNGHLRPTAKFTQSNGLDLSSSAVNQIGTPSRNGMTFFSGATFSTHDRVGTELPTNGESGGTKRGEPGPSSTTSQMNVEGEYPTSASHTSSVLNQDISTVLPSKSRNYLVGSVDAVATSGSGSDPRSKSSSSSSLSLESGNASDSNNGFNVASKPSNTPSNGLGSGPGYEGGNEADSENSNESSDKGSEFSDYSQNSNESEHGMVGDSGNEFIDESGSGINTDNGLNVGHAQGTDQNKGYGTNTRPGDGSNGHSGSYTTQSTGGDYDLENSTGAKESSSGSVSGAESDGHSNQTTKSGQYYKLTGPSRINTGGMFAQGISKVSQLETRSLSTSPTTDGSKFATTMGGRTSTIATTSVGPDFHPQLSEMPVIENHALPKEGISVGLAALAALCNLI